MQKKSENFWFSENIWKFQIFRKKWKIRETIWKFQIFRKEKIWKNLKISDFQKQSLKFRRTPTWENTMAKHVWPSYFPISFFYTVGGLRNPTACQQMQYSKQTYPWKETYHFVGAWYGMRGDVGIETPHKYKVWLWTQICFLVLLSGCLRLYDYMRRK